MSVPVPALRVVGGAGAAAELARVAADPTVRAVLVHDGVDLAPGAPGRLLDELGAPGRRLVRIVCEPARCYVLDRELLADALACIPARTLAAAGDDLDADLARILGLDPDAPVTDVADLTTGTWRHWVDGEAIGVRAAGTATARWRSAVRRSHSPVTRVSNRVRRVLGRARRGLARRRDRRSQER